MEKKSKMAVEGFISLHSPDRSVVEAKAKAATIPKLQPKPGSEVFLWFPTKRPTLDTIKELHPGIRDVRLPRQNTARWCIVVFSNKEKAVEARKVINGMKYEGSKGRRIKAKMKNVSTGPLGPLEGKLEVKTENDGELLGTVDVKKEEPMDIKEEDVSVNKQKVDEEAKILTPKRYWNSEPGSLLRIKPENMKKKQLMMSTPKSEPGSILRIKPKMEKRRSKLKTPRKSL